MPLPWEATAAPRAALDGPVDDEPEPEVEANPEPEAAAESADAPLDNVRALPVAAAPATITDDPTSWLDVEPAAPTVGAQAPVETDIEKLTAALRAELRSEMQATLARLAPPTEPEPAPFVDDGTDPVVAASVEKVIARREAAAAQARAQAQMEADHAAWSAAYSGAITQSKVFADAENEIERSALRKAYDRAIAVERDQNWRKTGRDLTPAQAAAVVAEVDAPMIAAMRRTKRRVINSRTAATPPPLSMGAGAVQRGAVTQAAPAAPRPIGAPRPLPTRAAAPQPQRIPNSEQWAAEIAARHRQTEARASRGR